MDKVSKRYLILAALILLVYMGKSWSQIFIPYSNWGCSDVHFTDSGSGDLTEGTSSNVGWNGTGLALTVGQTSGTYTSVPFDKLRCTASAFAAFDKLSWVSDLPYGKELPATSETTGNYTGLANSSLMTNIVGVWHLNGSGAIANNATIAAETGTAGTARNANGTGLSYTTAAKLSSAVSFDGTDDRIDLVGYTQTSVTDYTIALWIKSTGTGNQVFVQDRGGGTGQSLTLTMGNNPGNCTTTDGRVTWGLDSNSIWIGKCASSGAINDGNWHHVVGVWDGTSGAAVAASQFSIYVDGAAIATTTASVGTAPNAPITGNGDTKFGRHDAWAVNYRGFMDEVAIWSRALSATEVQQLYRRGANRIKFQIRSCASPSCFDNPTWLGYDGSSSTYFTELNNNTLPAAMNGSVKTGLPIMDFSDYVALILTNTQFLQYRITFESDSTTLVPSVKNISISY